MQLEELNKERLDPTTGEQPSVTLGGGKVPAVKERTYKKGPHGQRGCTWRKILGLRPKSSKRKREGRIFHKEMRRHKATSHGGGGMKRKGP